MNRPDDRYNKRVGIFPDGEVWPVLIDGRGMVFRDPSADESEYATLMRNLKLLAEARQVRVSGDDERHKRVAVLSPTGLTHFIKFEYTDKLASDKYQFVEFQAVEKDTHVTVTAKGRYWLEQWHKRRKEYNPT